MPKFYEVKNKLPTPLTLTDGTGDSIQLPPLSTHSVDAKFIEFQLPPISQAEVKGFDYAAHLAPKTSQPKTIIKSTTSPVSSSSGNRPAADED